MAKAKSKVPKRNELRKRSLAFQASATSYVSILHLYLNYTEGEFSFCCVLNDQEILLKGTLGNVVDTKSRQLNKSLHYC